MKEVSLQAQILKLLNIALHHLSPQRTPPVNFVPTINKLQ
jgi:hypothetical protein